MNSTDLTSLNEEYSQISEVAKHNFDNFGLNIQQPNRVVYGATPEGDGFYSLESDTVFVGETPLKSRKFSGLIVYEHENIHFEQFRRILGDTKEKYHERVAELTDTAFSNALDHFEDEELTKTLTDRQKLSFKNFKTHLGLLTEHSGFLEDIKALHERYNEKLDQMPVGIPIDTVQQCQYAELAEKAETIAERYWEEIIETEEAQRFNPLIARHDRKNLQYDILEAEAQFWQAFRKGTLEELPSEPEEFNEDLETRLESLDFYEKHEFYPNGANVRPATEELIENFRERKYTEEVEDSQIVVDILNSRLEEKS